MEEYLRHMKESGPGTQRGHRKFENWHGDGKSQSMGRDYSVYQTMTMLNTSGVNETKVVLKKGGSVLVRHKSPNWDASGELTINAMLEALAAEKGSKR